MIYPKGSSIAVGLLGGLIIGILMGSIISMTLIGIMFGLIGEMVNTQKDSTK